MHLNGSKETATETSEPVANGVKKESSVLSEDGQQSALDLPRKRSNRQMKEDEVEEEDDDDEPVKKRTRKTGSKAKPQPLSDEELQTEAVEEPLKSKKASSEKNKATPKEMSSKSKARKKSDNKDGKDSSGSKKPDVSSRSEKTLTVEDKPMKDNAPASEESPEPDDEMDDLDEDDSRDKVAAQEKVQSTLKSSGKDPYPDWKPGEPVPYAALCTTFSLIEMTSKRLIITAHCALFLRQVLRLTPQDLLPTIQLMINKLAADYAGIELGIGESLIMKAIGESTGRSLQVIKADQAKIGDLGLVAAKSRSNQPMMIKPKPLTVKGVLDGLMGIATTSGDGSQGRKIAGIKKLLSAADTAHAGKGSKGIDINKDKGGASESKFIIRFLEGKLRLGLAEKTVLVGLAQAMVSHEVEKNGNKLPSGDKLTEGEAILKTVYRYMANRLRFCCANTNQ